MLVAQIEPPHMTRGGDWYYRSHSPGQAMSAQTDVHVVNLLSTHPLRDQLFEGADVVVLNMLCDPDLLPLIADRARRQQPTIFELNDDIAALSAHSPTASFYRNPEHQLLFRMTAKACSAVQFSSRELQQLYGRFAAKSAIFENQLSCDLLPPSEHHEHPAPLVLGWGGSAGHFDDLAAIAGPLTQWLNSQDGVVLHLMCNDQLWSLFDALPASKKRHFSPGSIEEYHRFLAGIDIGLAPLLDSDFNRCRSDVKFLEYAVHGVVPLLQNVAAYRHSIENERTGLYFDSTQELLSALERLLANPELRIKMGQATQRQVTERRTEREQAPRRLAFYRSLLPNAGGSAQGQDWLSRQAVRPELTRQGRLWTFEASPFERLLHDALVLGQQERRHAEALAMLEHASRLEPDCYLPHLYSAAFSITPIASLERALDHNPRSIKARVLLAEHQFAKKQFTAAATTLMKAAELCPSYDVPYARLARFMTQLGQVHEANSFARLTAQLRAPFSTLSSAASTKELAELATQ